MRAASLREQSIENRIVQVISTIQESRFPLNSPICRQLKSLSGAEIIVRTKSGQVMATSDESLQLPPESPKPLDPQREFSLRSTFKLKLKSEEYYWIQTPLRWMPTSEVLELNVLYSSQEVKNETRQNLWPILWSCLLAWIFSTLLISVITQKIVRRLSHLTVQCRSIAAGNFEPMPVPGNLDEIRALAISVNDMAGRLAEAQVRLKESERLATLNFLGNGLAHQLRNYATGAMLAIDLIPSEPHPDHLRDNLEVAKRQLRLMETSIQNLLTLGSPRKSSLETIDLRELISDLKPLLEPHAKHAHANLEFYLGDQPMLVSGNRDRLSEAFVNLLLNAIQAVSAIENAKTKRKVWLHFTRQGNWAIARICDNGNGPPAELIGSMFEPFVTARKDGIGLGLSICRLVFQEHLGHIDFRREGEKSCFEAVLPLKPIEE